MKCASASRAASSPCERVTIQRASASFASRGRLRREELLLASTSRYHSERRSSEIRIVRPNCSSGRAASGMLFPTDELIFSPSQRDQQRRREDDLRREPVRLHHLATGEQVVELVGSAELDVGLDRNGVVRLHERIQELGDGDRLAGRVAFGEVVALEHLRHRHDPREPDDVGEAELASHSLLNRTSVRSG